MARWIHTTACSATAVFVLLASIASARQVVINFDGMQGKPPPFSVGAPVAPQYLVNNQFLSQGVLFYSDGGGVAVTASSNSPSAPNCVCATAAGPVLSYTAPVTASFWCGPVAARVDTVSIRKTSTTYQMSLDAYDLAGFFLGSTSAPVAGYFTLTFPGQIHSVMIQQGPMAFDDFTFDPQPFCAPQSYCTAGTTTNGCVPSINSTGAASASSSTGFTIRVNAVEGLKTGLIFYGIDNSGFAALPWGTGSSYLCVKHPLQRTGPQNSGGSFNACDGALTLDWNAYRATHAAALGSPFAAGQHVFAQGWFRDPPSPKSTILSDALEFAVGP